MAMEASKVKLSEPRRKPRAPRDEPPLFPLVVEHGTYKCFSGMLVDDVVVVTDPRDAEFLSTMGFFGKGNLSSRGMEYEKRKRASDGYYVMSKRRYENHLTWQAMQTSDETRLNMLSSPENRNATTTRCAQDGDSVSPGKSGERMDVHVSTKCDEPHATASGGSGNTHAENLLVKPDSDEEVEEGMSTGERAAAPTSQPFLAIDPYPVTEHLQLYLEEAFFLAYGLGCLCVTRGNDAEAVAAAAASMTLEELWLCFCSRQERFAARYVAYHYYRSRGWVVCSGLKYGADFSLYKKGPPYYHSTYSVIVKYIDGATMEHIGNEQPSSWKALAALDRITQQVGKEVLFCHVIKPVGLTHEDYSSPECISSFTVQEVLLRRWVPSEGRMEESGDCSADQL
ncbi:PREDICTED: tRNA-splicing endonuclease subunit Sen2-like [Priapulus caudatus]|uniref:tRNA-splicing endonuclease subunit Sen2 n=1 Tax=Priapulus caudatus TaxID=37621 RepID=A0ABM1F0Z9_PRICU|nr:PREDICTED: tRNA-splicing endonuclease subunit Sen2-like [Priapulus caudatus]